MAMFKAVVREQLKLLVIVFLLGNSFWVLPANPANACGRDPYVRLLLIHCLLAVTVLAAATLLLAVRAAASTAEAAAAAKGVLGGYVVAVKMKWPGASLRATLLAAVVLSAAASFLAVVAFEDGFRYWTGCVDADDDDAGVGEETSTGAVLMCLVGAVHGFSAWVAVSQN